MVRFHAERAYGWGPNGETTSWKLVNRDRLSNVLESDQRWETETEAQAAAERVNSGDNSGISFSSFADD